MTALKLFSFNLSRMTIASCFCCSVDKPLLDGQLILATEAIHAARNSRFTSGSAIFILSSSLGLDSATGSDFLLVLCPPLGVASSSALLCSEESSTVVWGSAEGEFAFLTAELLL